MAELSRNGVHLALVDMMLPGVNGLELARRIRFLYPDVGIVIMSAYHVSEEQICRLGIGALGFVPKPYSLDDLAGFIRNKFKTLAQPREAEV